MTNYSLREECLRFVTPLDESPMLEVWLGKLREEETDSSGFLQAVHAITSNLFWRATEPIKMTQPGIDTRAARITTGAGHETDTKVLKKPPVLVPIARAGEAMLHPFQSLLPSYAVGWIGMARDEENPDEQKVYLNNLPEIKDRDVYVLDVMNATGGSACTAIQLIKDQAEEEKGVANSITLVNIVTAPEGAVNVHNTHPLVNIVTAAMDEGLDERKFIVPGLGDAGDRLFGTK